MAAKEYRQKAWEVCEPNIGKLALVTLVYEIIVGALGALSAIGVGALAILLVGGPLALGYIHAIVNNVKKEEFNCNTLFTGFGDFGKTFLVQLLINIFTFLWSLLFVIPGIIKGLAYSMAMFIHNDHPEYAAGECIGKSVMMMNGHKWELFCLELSYIGWFFLCALTCGILTFWVMPKFETAIYLFYQDINPDKVVKEVEQVEEVAE